MNPVSSQCGATYDHRWVAIETAKIRIAAATTTITAKLIRPHIAPTLGCRPNTNNPRSSPVIPQSYPRRQNDDQLFDLDQHRSNGRIIGQYSFMDDATKLAATSQSQPTVWD